MTGQGWKTYTCHVVIAGVATALSCGCQALRTSWSHGAPPASSPAATTPPVPANPAIAPDEKEQAAVAMVADFLDRTKDYDATATPAKGAAALPTAASPVGGEAARRSAPAAAAPAPIAPSEPNAAPAGSVPATAPRESAVANAQIALSDSSLRPGPAAPTVKSLTLRSPPAALTGTVEPARSSASNLPLEAHAGEADASPERLLAALESRARTGGWDAEWAWRLGQLAFGAAVAPGDVGATLAPEERKLMAGVVGLVAAVRSSAQTATASVENALAQADELRHSLAERADPAVTAVALCRKVVTFGVFEEMAADDLVAGRSTPSIVYCEIRNLRAERTSEGDFRTRLSTRLELLTAAGESLWRHEEPEIIDTCRRRRSDFFIAQRITLPPTLAEGEHVLKVTVEDLLSGRVNEGVHRFNVGAGASLARGR